MKQLALLPLISLILLLPSGLTFAQAENEEEVEPIWKTMECLPAAATELSFDVRLFPDYSEMEPGNAAPVFLRMWAELPRTFWDNIGFARANNRLERPLNDFVDEKLTFTLREEEFVRAARCTDVDWNRGLYTTEDTTSILLPDVQQGRALLYAYACNIRHDIAHGQVDEAIKKLEAGFGVCRHLQDTPFFVVKLVGNIELQFLIDQIEELVQQPNCPNLYWALQRLPSPLIDMRGVIDFETLVEPEAVLRQATIANADNPEKLAEVVSQTSELTRQIDLSYRWFHLSPDKAIPRLVELELKINGSKEQEKFWQAGSNVRLYNRLHYVDRQVAALITLEAIRAYAAKHDGELPKSLGKIKDTPTVDDPFTSEPFRYKSKNNIAFLLTEEIEGIDNEEFGFKYKIEFGKPEKQGKQK